ncbi:forkhead box protein k1 [Biomphalaria glabrata]|nr:KACytosolic 10-formyltetrahydrofolate dehydrogenase [Biomphalaria glabrata]
MIPLTDDNPQHQHCSIEWCGISRMQYKHKHGLPQAIFNFKKPIFDELADKSLLSKCLHGQTQNANEALNKLIWDRCSKRYYVEKNVIEEAVYSALAYFNDGAESVLELHTKLGLGQGFFSRQMCTKKDLKRKSKDGPMQLKHPKRDERPSEHRKKALLIRLVR